MEITTINKFIKNVSFYMSNIDNQSEPLTIASDNGNAVLLSEEEYRGLLETAYLNSIPGMKEKTLEGVNTPASECSPFNWREELK